MPVRSISCCHLVASHLFLHYCHAQDVWNRGVGVSSGSHGVYCERHHHGMDTNHPSQKANTGIADCFTGFRTPHLLRYLSSSYSLADSNGRKSVTTASYQSKYMEIMDTIYPCSSEEDDEKTSVKEITMTASTEVFSDRRHDRIPFRTFMRDSMGASPSYSLLNDQLSVDVSGGHRCWSLVADGGCHLRQKRDPVCSVYRHWHCPRWYSVLRLFCLLLKPPFRAVFWPFLQLVFSP